MTKQLKLSDAPSATGQCLSIRPLMNVEDEAIRRCGGKVDHAGKHWCMVYLPNKLKFRVYW